jgi:hypothetical protein
MVYFSGFAGEGWWGGGGADEAAEGVGMGGAYLAPHFGYDCGDDSLDRHHCRL